MRDAARAGGFARVAKGTAVAVLFLAFVASGAGKLAASDFNVEGFDAWGYPLWFMYAVGAAEVAGGVLVLVPRVKAFGASLRFWGAIGLAAVMVGAVGTHVVHAEYAMIPLPLGLLAVSGGLAWSTRPGHTGAGASEQGVTS